MARPKFPYRKSDDTAVSQGERVTTVRYQHEIKQIAETILEQVREEGVRQEGRRRSRWPYGEYRSFDDAAEMIRGLAEENAESHNTYTIDCIRTLLASHNWEAIEGDDACEPGVGVVAAARAATCQDIIDEIWKTADWTEQDEDEDEDDKDE